MGNIEIFTSASRRENVEGMKMSSKKEINGFIEQLEREMDFEIMPLIEKIISKQAKSFSLSRDNPMRYVFVSNGGNNISIGMRAVGKQTKVLIPKAAFKI